MEKTWIAKFLPKDEYREKRVLYFIAEAAIILGVMLFFYLLFDSFITKIKISGEMIALLSFGFLVAYITFRSTLTGIEYPDITTEKRYKKEKRAKVSSSIIFWIIFLLVYTISKGFPSNVGETLDIVVPATLAAIFFFIINYVSLKKSYKKNKELLDD